MMHVGYTNQDVQTSPQPDQMMAISPIDGRYANKVTDLREYFSEYALMKYRVEVEVEYFILLVNLGLPELEHLNLDEEALRELYLDFTVEDAIEIKSIEATTNHDVKAVEYWLRKKFIEMGYGNDVEFIHFGLTSQDINNTAIPLLLQEFKQEVLSVSYGELVMKLRELVKTWSDIPMLARTHGQPASPTRLGKELHVFVARLESQLSYLESIDMAAKFGGATGNFNAHVVAYPDIDWPSVMDDFLIEEFGLHRTTYTTQIESYDNLAEHCDGHRRVNNILIDLCRDIWHYISIGYFKQKTKAGEVGSSAMPHKVNPIDFENAEGNLGVANAMFDHFSNKLPISRLQRDLTDSTVLRNLGVPFAHTVIAIESIIKGLGKLELNQQALANDLANTPEVLAEAIQTILRRERYPDPYNALKQLTRGANSTITMEGMFAFIDNLDVREEVKAELRSLSPETYVGVFLEPSDSN